MSNRKFKEVPFHDVMVRVAYDDANLITHICLNDICSILHRERMIGSDELQRTCPTAIQLGDPAVFKNLPWFVHPFDITRLTRKLSKEGKIIAMACNDIESWLSVLPWGKANREHDDFDRFDTIGVTKTTLELEFEGHPIVFRIMNNRVYVNATQMAHIYDTLPSSWLRKVEVVKWMDELVESREFPDLDTQVITVKGKYGGTWIEEKLGIVFARSLSEEMHKWYMGALKTLLPNKYGLPQKLPKDEKSDDDAFVMPETLEQAQTLILELKEKISTDRHKVEFYTDYVDEREWFKSVRVADELEISPYRLHQFLMEQGICSYEKRQWVVRPQYQALQAEIPYLWTNAQGKTYAFGKIRRWTQAGREYILDLYRKNYQ